MCDPGSTNLIDLSLDDDCTIIENKTEIEEIEPSKNAQQKQTFSFISPPRKKRDSLENNPFDCLQKLANRQDDPFDIVEREARFKAKHQGHQSLPAEVQLGNLISINDDICLDLDNESPPITMKERSICDSMSASSGPDSDSSAAVCSSTESTASVKMNKVKEYRKRLLKLSLSNSALNSPISRKNSIDECELLNTPVSSVLSRAAQYGEDLFSESPLKLVDDDMVSDRLASYSEAEKNFEADLEMLKIPILSELQSPSIETEPTSCPNLNSDKGSKLSPTLPSSTLLGLEAIKAKLKANRVEFSNHNKVNGKNEQDISTLILNLKSLISNGNIVDDDRKQQASVLLETLSSALSPKTQQGEITQNNQNIHNLLVPPFIKRQGTFDLDLQQQLQLDSQPLISEMPNCMVSSSATYDGETADEKQDLDLPEIEPIVSETEFATPPSNMHQSHHHEAHISQDVNDIMEQLSRLLIQKNSSENGSQSNSNSNPTFIVVMNTPQAAQNSLVTSFMEKSLNDELHNLNKSSNPTVRRRSQSLSIHDKVKIVQIPLPPTPSPSQLVKNANFKPNDSDVITTPPSNDLDTPEFKTPARMVRRNSYSSGTPHTASVGLGSRRLGPIDGKNSFQMRRTQTLDTHHEGQIQQQAIVRPMPIPNNGLALFKPDLKKKLKTNSESIMKSSGPLKATIPVKKVAPMVKISPARSPNTSLQMPSGNYKSSHKIPTTPIGKSSSGLSVPQGYPNACSTPSSFTSPINKSGAQNKPRYSYLSTTPNSKLTTSVTSGLKRRTITEFKAKSPMKTRSSNIGGSHAPAPSNASSSRLSTSSGARLPSRTPTKSVSNTAAVRPTNRLGSTRMSVSGSSIPARNKENKRP